MLNIKHPTIRTLVNFFLCPASLLLSFWLTLLMVQQNNVTAAAENGAPEMKASFAFIYVFVLLSLVFCGAWLVKTISSLKTYEKYGLMYKANIAIMLFSVFFLIPAAWFTVVKLYI